MITRDLKVLCCCSGGKVRSVAAKYVLEDEYGFDRVLCCGLDKNARDVVELLCAWADVIFVVGEPELLSRTPRGAAAKVRHLDVGEDTYHSYTHERLLEQLRTLLSDQVEV